MRKLFGRKKKGLEGPDSSLSSPTSPNRTQFTPNSPQNEVLSVQPGYLNVREFALPETAQSVFAKARDEEILLDRCRWCSDGFAHTFMGWTTNIIAGVPQTDDYRAISYVWGKTIQLPMRCSQCGHRFHIPMESAYRFRRLMMMTATSGESIWLDALSIDQTSDEEKSKVLAVMGDIYSQARMVAVLFPHADGEAFHLIYDITQAATAINVNKKEFSLPGQDGHSDPRLEQLTMTCKRFWQMLEMFDRNLHTYVYWRRAWTFQEWALAENISITWEGGIPRNLEMVKTTTLHAATLTAIYAFMHGSYAIIKMGFPQAAVPERFEVVRRLFPDEMAFQPPGTIDEMEVAVDMMIPSLRFGSALGLRTARSPGKNRLAAPLAIEELYVLRPMDNLESSEDQFRRRLCMALHAFGVSKREARYEADLVNCWASMCNIKYAYDAHDSYAQALQKVLYSLRAEHGLNLFNFQVNTTGASGEVDTSFQEYATPHEQCNAGLVKGKFSDIPIFTGRADTGVHLRLALSRPPAATLPKLTGHGVALRKIHDAFVVYTVPMTDHRGVLTAISAAISGTTDGMVFGNLLTNIAEILETTPVEQLARYSLAIVRIPLDSPEASSLSKMVGLMTWAIIPREDAEAVNAAESSSSSSPPLFVAREDLNGTLVLAGPAPGNDKTAPTTPPNLAMRMRIVAYLTLTDHQSGTHLLRVSSSHDPNAPGYECRQTPTNRHPCTCRHGDVLVELKSPKRRGVVNAALLDDRIVRGRIPFDPAQRKYIAY